MRETRTCRAHEKRVARHCIIRLPQPLHALTPKVEGGLLVDAKRETGANGHANVHRKERSKQETDEKTEGQEIQMVRIK